MKTKTRRSSKALIPSNRQKRVPATRHRRPLVLTVDDDSGVREIIKLFLEVKAGVRVVEAETSKAALILAQRRKFDLVISDITRPGMDGIEFLQVFKKAHPEVPVIIASGSLNDSKIKLAHRLGVCCCIPKPFSAAKLFAVVRKALRIENQRT